MAKMGNGSGLREIPLSQIVETGNVRFDYKDIKELAESIKTHGQLNPVQVKPYEPNEDGIERFEIVAGHRRRLAVKMLCDMGESFTSLKAVIVTGDKLTLQLVENLQRDDLTAIEREKGIYEMCKNGLSQKEVAARLSKSEPFISRNISAYKIREAARTAGIDTLNLATATLNEIQAAKPVDYPALIKEILNNGGTSEAARAVMQNYRAAGGKPTNLQRDKDSSGLNDPLGLHPSPATDAVLEELSESGIDTDLDIDMGYSEPAENVEREKPAKKEGTKSATSYSWLEEFEPPPHKQVDFNAVCLVIVKYAKEVKDSKKTCDLKDYNLKDCENCQPRCVHGGKLEALNDIIALLHNEL